MEVLKSTFLLIKYSVPTILIEWTNLLRIKSLNVKFSKYQKQLSEAVLWKGVLNIFARFIEKYQNIRDAVLKGNAQFIFLCNSQNHRLMFFSWKMLKSTVTKKVIVCGENFRWRKFLKLATYVILPTSIMPLFEICQRFKGHFLNELRVSFNLKFQTKRSATLLKGDFGICAFLRISPKF